MNTLQNMNVYKTLKHMFLLYFENYRTKYSPNRSMTEQINCESDTINYSENSQRNTPNNAIGIKTIYLKLYST